MIKYLLNGLLGPCLEVQSSHFSARSLRAWAVEKDWGFVFSCTDRVTGLVNSKYTPPVNKW